MSMNISQALKTAETKLIPKKKLGEDKDESFLESFNKLLEKKKLDVKTESKDKVKEGKSPKKVEDLKNLEEYININYFLMPEFEEKDLKIPEAFEFLEDFLIVEGEELFGEENLKFESLLPELQGQFKNPDLTEDAKDSLLEIDLKNEEELLKEKNLNFPIEKARANLHRALNTDVRKLEIDEEKLLGPKALEAIRAITESQNLEEPEGLEGSKKIDLKNEVLDKLNPVDDSKEIDGTAFKTIDKTKDVGDKRLEPSLKAESLVEAKEVDLEDIDFLKEDKNEIKEEVEPVKENTLLEEPKLVDPNMIFNRIQNSILEFQEEDILSMENIQSIEDSMIKFMKLSKEGDTSLMRVKLYPEELGSIDISLKLDKGKLLADIIVASEKVKELFLNNSSLLNKNLIEANIPVKNINIKVQDAFENLGDLSGQSGNSGSKKGNRKATGGRNISRELKNSPIDNMRIGNINRSGLGTESLNILA